VIKATGRRKTKVVFVQLGSPKSPKVSDVRRFLREFLGDPRVVDLPRWFWNIILYLFVLPFRPAKSARAYSRIWDGANFPLITITEAFTKEVARHLPNDLVEVNHAFLLSTPRVSDVWDAWERDIETQNDPATKLVVVPMFPQYSESTIASGADGFFHELKNRVKLPPFEFFTDFHRSRAFIDNSVRRIEERLSEFKKTAPVDKLVISFHGIPKRRVIQKGDAYYQHCYETFVLLRDRVQELHHDDIVMTFQSRFGSEEWLTPYTDECVEELIKDGNKRIAVYCPSFVADCLETIDEIGNELKEEAHEWGGEILFIDCLNSDETWCKDFAGLIYRHVEGSGEERARDYYTIEEKDYTVMPEVTMKSEPLTPEARGTLSIVFLTLFLDLVGFSIIFPLFPALAAHYLEVDGGNFLLRSIFDGAHWLMASGGASSEFSSIVLFGGALGALYSLLQFVAAPLWGGLSDRFGRRPILLISVAGLALSYLLWFFSGSFTLLVIARIVGGLMGGNISAATAVVTDITTEKNRSRGMAFIGIAFALGFIIGPAIGGIASLIDLTALYPSLKAYGVNPFSMPALIAFVLSLFNLYYLARKFKETRKPQVDSHESARTANPLRLFRPLPFKGVNQTNLANFLFIAAFSGMEFTLTFLAAERLNFSPLQNAYMFIFIGLWIALIQGGVVRRRAHDVGEKKMAVMGLALIVPGLLSIALTQSVWLLYVGLFFLSVGSAMVIPCLTTLVSFYTPANQQGQSIGIFRSMGALGRVFGPILASMIYWRFGSAAPYYLGAMALLIPLILVQTLPNPKANAESTH
jgi:ferrochelatase